MKNESHHIFIVPRGVGSELSLWWGAGLVFACLLTIPAFAQADPNRFPVDDSASQVLRPVLPMQWEQLVPGPKVNNRVSAETVVLVRLNLQRWAGQHARILMTLPTTGFGEVTARWTTQGRMLPGEIQSGGEVTVFNGAIPTDGQLEDTFQLRLSTDGLDLERSESLHFGFQIVPGNGL